MEAESDTIYSKGFNYATLEILSIKISSCKLLKTKKGYKVIGLYSLFQQILSAVARLHDGYITLLPVSCSRVSLSGKFYGKHFSCG